MNTDQVLSLAPQYQMSLVRVFRLERTVCNRVEVLWVWS